MSEKITINKSQRLPWEEANYLAERLYRDGNFKGSAYVMLGINFGLRFSDLQKVSWGDILESSTGVWICQEKKTSKITTRHITPTLKTHIEKCWSGLNWPESSTAILLNNRKEDPKPISRQSQNKTLKRWHDLYNLSIERGRFSTHSFRKCAGYRFYEVSGYNLEAARNFLNHSSIEVTRVYLELLDIELKDLVYQMNQ